MKLLYFLGFETLRGGYVLAAMTICKLCAYRDYLIAGPLYRFLCLLCYLLPFNRFCFLLVENSCKLQHKAPPQL